MKIGDRIFVRGYIDEIRKDTVIVRNDGGYFGTIPSEVITGELPSAQPEQRWIPCSERLPEEKDAGILKKLGTSKRSEYVLATAEVKGERMTVTACTYDGEWHWDKKYAFPDYKIVAWMPLPQPWEGDDK